MNTEPQTQADDFASVILTVDHTTSPRADGNLLQKFVASTEDLLTSMLSLITYYDEEKLLSSKATIQQFNQADREEFPMFLFRTKENLQIVMSADTFTMLVTQAEGNFLAATSLVLNTAGEVISNMEQQAGGAMPLILFAWTREPAPTESTSAE